MSTAGVTVKLKGDAEIEKALAGLPSHIQQYALGKAVSSAIEIVADAIRQRANFGPYSTGKLKQSIEARLTQIGGEPSGVVIPSRKRGAVGYRAHLAEFGTSPHGGHPGTSAQPFFEPGLEASQDYARDAALGAIGDTGAAYWSTKGGDV